MRIPTLTLFDQALRAAVADTGKLGRVASGNHLAAQNDEREPGDLSEADLAAIDREFGIDKDSGVIAQREADRAAVLESRAPGHWR